MTASAHTPARPLGWPLALALALLILLAPVPARADETDASSQESAQTTVSQEAEATSQVVRVGYFTFGSYLQGVEGEYKSGAGYEYLQRVASYNGWECEYVYGSFSDLFEMLAAGQIDLMCNVVKTDDRAELVDYSAYPTGTDQYIVAVLRTNSELNGADASALASRSVGVVTGTNESSELAQWLEEEGIEGVTVRDYPDDAALQLALEAGEVDAAVWVDGTLPSSCSYLAVFGENDHYFVTNPQKPWLKEQLDAAQEEILANDPSYNEELMARYSTYRSNEATLDEDELEWISERSSVRVGFLTDVAPYSSADDEGAYDGVFDVVLEQFEQFTGLGLEYVGYETYQELLAALLAGEVDLALPVNYSYALAEERGMLVSDEVLTLPVVVLTREGFDASSVTSVAAGLTSYMQEDFALLDFPDAEVVHADTFIDSLYLVLEGEADCAFFTRNLYYMTLQQNADFLDLVATDYSRNVSLSFGLRRGDTILYSIVNKCISDVSDEEINASLTASTYRKTDASQTIWDILEQNRTALAVALVAVVVLVALLVAWHVRSTREHRRLEELLARYQQADHDRRTDFLTGLPNKQDLFEIMQGSIDKDTFSVDAMFMLDIDDYKSYNDHYGHQAGDDVLRKLGAALKDYGERNHVAMHRFGGEEFLGVGTDLRKPPAQIAEELVALVAGLGIEREDIATGRITVSAGFTDEDARYEVMVEHADKAMYAAKRAGKNRACAYVDAPEAPEADAPDADAPEADAPDAG